MGQHGAVGTVPSAGHKKENATMVRSMDRELQQFLRPRSLPVEMVAKRLLKLAVAGNKQPAVEAVLKVCVDSYIMYMLQYISTNIYII